MSYNQIHVNTVFLSVPRKVFDTQGATEEQEKLRRKSLLLMLKVN